MRLCVRCHSEMAKSGNESRYQFAARKYCNVECVNAAKRERNDPRRVKRETQLEAKVRAMGSVKITNAKLNADKVKKIRELHKPLGFSIREIAELYQLKYDLVAKVIQRVTWNHVL